MGGALASFALAAIISGLLVGYTFIALVGQAFGRRNRSTEALAKFLLAPGRWLSEENAAIRLGGSWLAWTLVLGSAFYVITLAR